MGQRHSATQETGGATNEDTQEATPQVTSAPIDIQDFITNQVFQWCVTEESQETRQQARESGDLVDGSDPDYDSFITEVVIPKSEEQRRKWQFATLMLLSASETQHPHRFRFKPNRQGCPLLNSNDSLSPSPDKFNNYIIARPEEHRDGTKHAEVVILEDFNRLLEAYKRNNKKQEPVSIVLHSWIMPCKDCTDLIIQRLSNLGISVKISYTISWRYESKKDQEENRRRMTSCGITVEQVQYPHRLNPK